MTSDAPDITAEDWPLVAILIDVQRGKIGILTALYRIRKLIERRDACAVNMGGSDEMARAGSRPSSWT